jgi:hypothetical protein
VISHRAAATPSGMNRNTRHNDNHKASLRPLSFPRNYLTTSQVAAMQAAQTPLTNTIFYGVYDPVIIK